MCGTIAQFVTVLAALCSDLGPQADGSIEQLLGSRPAVAGRFEPSDPLIPPPSAHVPLLPTERLPRLEPAYSLVSSPLPTFTHTPKSEGPTGASIADQPPSLPYLPNPLPDDLPSQPISPHSSETQRATYDAPIGPQSSNSPSDGLENPNRQPNTADADTSDFQLRYILALIAMFGSWGLCVYLFWVAMQSRSRYRALLRETGDLVTP